MSPRTRDGFFTESVLSSTRMGSPNFGPIVIPCTLRDTFAPSTSSKRKRQSSIGSTTRSACAANPSPMHRRGRAPNGRYCYGAGPRLCIGMGFAAQALRIVLPMLLSRFRFELVDGARVSRKVQGITMGPRHGLPVRVLARDAVVKKPSRVRGDIDALVDLAP